MSKITFNLKAVHAVTVRALNGKLYKLQSGSNTLTLEYSDYVSLMNALKIGPKSEPSRMFHRLHKEAAVEQKKEYAAAEQKEVTSVEEQLREEVSETDKMEEPQKEDDTVEDHIQASEDATKKVEATELAEEKDIKSIDYASMTYSQLKSEYKKVTGKYCKLKKDELIQFLQENCNV